MSKKNRVLVAMSGGIDSAVTAYMLHSEGYEVVGITMKTWDYANSGVSKKETGCCSLDSINDAREMAVELGFHHSIIDIRDEFGDYVIDNFVDEYIAGRTPNPCILCNTHIKWEALLKRAEILKCDKIATGHYAKMAIENGRRYVKKAKDLKKDQSYVLWGLSQECLSKTIFPLGDYTKTEVRAIAAAAGFDELSKKGESYEICFVPDNDYRSFLKNRLPDLEESVANGEIVDQKGKVLGKHKGYPFYTIGQRKGLGLAFSEPMYVTDIRPETNQVVLGRSQDLIKNGLVMSKVNWMKSPSLDLNKEYVAKIRYQDKGTLCQAKALDDDTIRLNFKANVSGVAPGQSAVLYDGDDVVAGGLIENSL